MLNAIYKEMGMAKKAKGIAFSLPVSDVAGLAVPEPEKRNDFYKKAPEWGGELRKHFSKERCSQTAMPFFAVFELYFGLFLSPVQNQMHR